MKTHIRICFALLVLSTIASILSCSKSVPETPIDGTTGIVSTDYKPGSNDLAPLKIDINSPLKNYTIIEHLAFLSQQDTIRRALNVTFRRVLSDNRFIRAQRDFSGFIYNGSYWVALPYTKAKQDSTRLDLDSPYPFGALQWNASHDGGNLSYDRRDVESQLEFSGLKVVQRNTHGDNRRTNAMGSGTLTFEGGSFPGTVYYELIEVAGYNPIDTVRSGIEFTNYDWIALMDPAGNSVIASSDSTTEIDRILKNFVVVNDGSKLLFADGSANVRIASSEVHRDTKIYDFLALRKSLSVPQLQMGFEINLVEPRIFYTNGYAMSIVTGTWNQSGADKPVWGIIEHWQKPKSPAEVLQ